jgi:hypothetical protein
VFCYNKQTAVRDTNQIFPPLIWHISYIVVDCLFPIVCTCVLNQSHGHWLFNDALHSTISMSLKLKAKKIIILLFESLIKHDSISFDELSLIAFNVKKEVINVLYSLLSFLKKYENKKAQNMISLMLDPHWKGARCCSY